MFSKIISQLTRLAGLKKKQVAVGRITQPTKMIGTGYYYFTLSKQDSNGNVPSFRFQYSEINSQNFLKKCRVTFIPFSNEVIQVTKIEFL